jgi:hypothetical protein
MLGMPGVCYNPEIHKIRRRRADEGNTEPGTTAGSPVAEATQKVA